MIPFTPSSEENLQVVLFFCLKTDELKLWFLVKSDFWVYVTDKKEI